MVISTSPASMTRHAQIGFSIPFWRQQLTVTCIGLARL